MSFRTVRGENGEPAQRIVNHPKDGSRKRTRKHQGFIAQEVEAICKRMDVDFAGLQHHAKSGGDDIYSIGYDEYIPVLVEALQEQQRHILRLEERVAQLEGQ